MKADSTTLFHTVFRETVLEGVSAFFDIDGVPTDTTLSLEHMPFACINYMFNFDEPHVA